MFNRKKLPVIGAFDIPNTENRIEREIFSKWSPGLKTKDEKNNDENNVIQIYEVIGEDFWTGGGFTAKRMAGALRSIGKKKDVVVSINSPGGDTFEGAAIYNLLREHEGKVTVKIIGLAASAAAVIAMAGDVIQIADLGFLMIHNNWGIVIGDKKEMRKAADIFQKFDDAIADVFSSRSGQEKDKVVEMLDNETWITANEAIELGFADEKLDSDVVEDTDPGDEKKSRALAKRMVEKSLARDGHSRKEREEILAKIFGARDAAGSAVRDAGEEEKLKSLLKSIKGG